MYSVEIRPRGGGGGTGVPRRRRGDFSHQDGRARSTSPQSPLSSVSPMCRSSGKGFCGPGPLGPSPRRHWNGSAGCRRRFFRIYRLLIDACGGDGLSIVAVQCHGSLGPQGEGQLQCGLLLRHGHGPAGGGGVMSCSASRAMRDGSSAPPHSTAAKPVRAKAGRSCSGISTGSARGCQAMNTRRRLSG